MSEITKKEVSQGELQQFRELLHQHEIGALIAKHQPPSLEVCFDFDWLHDNVLAASFRRTKTMGPNFITLSPLLLECGLTDRIAISTIILHELAHVIDRVQNWGKYVSTDSVDPEIRECREYEADDFVIACGWRDGLIETLQRSIDCVPEYGVPEGMLRKRLSRLFVPA